MGGWCEKKLSSAAPEVCEMDWFGVVPRFVAAARLLIIYARCLGEGGLQDAT
jgi:hypothetical protein